MNNTFTMVFSRKRFLQIFWVLHVPQDTEGLARQPPCGSKMRSIIKYTDKKCPEHFSPGPEVYMDESIVGLEGRVPLKCYNLQKPMKWDLHIYVLADCVIGYIQAFEPYYGSTTADGLCCPDLHFTCHIVLHLLDKVKQASRGGGYHLYTGRLYHSSLLKSCSDRTKTRCPAK